MPMAVFTSYIKRPVQVTLDLNPHAWAGLSQRIADQQSLVIERLQNSMLVRRILTDKVSHFAQLIAKHAVWLIEHRQDTDQALGLMAYQKAIDDGLTAEKISLISEFALFQAITQQSSHDLVMGLEALQDTQRAIQRWQQAQQLGAAPTEIARHVFDRIPASILETSPVALSPDLQQMESHFAELLSEWSQYPSDLTVASELEFIRLFIHRLIARYDAPPRLWEILLLRLDRLLTDKLHHPLTEVIAILFHATPRFELIRQFITSVPEHSENELLRDSVVVWMVLQAHLESPLYQRILEQIDLERWAEIITSAELDIFRQQVIPPLRDRFERFQSDWITDAIDFFQHLLNYQQLSHHLVNQHQDSLYRLSHLLTEGISQSGGAKAALQLLGQILREACYAAAVTPHLLTARAIFRRRLTLINDFDEHRALWKKHREITLALQRLDLPATPWQPSIEKIKPILVTLDSITHDNLNLAPQWFGSTELITHLLDDGSKDDGLSESMLVLLALVAIYRREYDTYPAAQQLKKWYAEHLLNFNQIPGLSVLEQVVKRIDDHLAHSQPPVNTEIYQTWRQFTAYLPHTTLAGHILPQWSAIHADMESRLKSAAALAGQSLAQENISALLNNNQFFLLRAVQLLHSDIVDPKAELVYWWNTAFIKNLTHRDQSLFETNLATLTQTLKAHLTASEANALTTLIQATYTETLGFRMDAAFNQTVLFPLFRFNTFELKAPVWQLLFSGQERLLPKYIRIVQPHIKELTDHPVIRQCLTTFIEQLTNHGEQEAAWCAIQPLLRDALKSLLTAELELEWRTMLYRIADKIPVPNNGYWTLTFQQGIEIIRQVGLGQQLAKSAKEITQKMADDIMTMIGMQDDRRAHLQSLCQRDLELFCQHTATVLTNQPPTLAALHIGRYLVEGVSPFVYYPASTWHIVWFRLEELLLPKLDTSEQFALHRWIAQLDAMSDALPDTHEIAKQIFYVKDFIFADDVKTEQHWRDCIGGLLTAAITPDDAPIPGQALTQRLLLSSPLFKEETANSWRDRQTALHDAFGAVLPDALDNLINARHLQIIDGLSQITQLKHNAALRSVDLFYATFYGLPYVQALWLYDSATQHSSERIINLLPNELLICQIAHWQVPESETLKRALAAYQEVSRFRDELTVTHSKWGGLGGQTLELDRRHRHELKLFLHLVAAYSVLPLESASHAWRTAMLESWMVQLLSLFFNTHSSDEKMAIFSSLYETLEQQVGHHKILITYCQQLLKTLPVLTLAGRLIQEDHYLAENVVTRLNPYRHVQEETVRRRYQNLCIRDTRFILRRFGLHLGKLHEIKEIHAWYWQRISVFLPTKFHKSERDFILNVPKSLRKILTAAEAGQLELLFNDLSRIFNDKQWQSYENSG